jgi:RNase P/RNase MRP subunit POP5
MNIYEKEIYSNLTLTIEHFTFYKKIYVFNFLVVMGDWVTANLDPWLMKKKSTHTHIQLDS